MTLRPLSLGQNADFFYAYNVMLRVNDQIVAFNYLVRRATAPGTRGNQPLTRYTLWPQVDQQALLQDKLSLSVPADQEGQKGPPGIGL